MYLSQFVISLSHFVKTVLALCNYNKQSILKLRIIVLRTSSKYVADHFSKRHKKTRNRDACEEVKLTNVFTFDNVWACRNQSQQ